MNKLTLIFLYTFALALFFAVAVFFIDQRITWLAIIFAIISAISLLGFLLGIKDLRQHRLGSAWKRVVYFVLIIGAYIIVYVQINLLVVHNDRRWDLTLTKQHTLLPKTAELIQKLNEHIKFTAFFVGEPPKYLEDLFKEYERVSDGKITTEIVDPLVDLGYAAQFGSTINSKENKVIVQSASANSQRQDVDFTETPLTEDQLNNAIIRVMRRALHAYLLTGHNEYDIFSEKENGMNEFSKLLIANNIIAQSLMLGTENKIPDDCDVLIIAGPKNPLTAQERDIIQNYLKQGGDALFLIENIIVTTPDVPLTEEQLSLNPSLNEILNAWGLEVGSDVVVDLANHAGSDVGSPATRNYMPHKSLIGHLDYTFYIRPRSIRMLSNRPPTVKLAPFVMTMSTQGSWAETDHMLNVKYDELIDRPGPVPISFVAWEPKDQNKKSDTRIIVFTDADFLTNAYLKSYSNAQMGLNVIQWITEMEYQPFVTNKTVNMYRLDLTSQQKRMVLAVLLFIPLVIVLAGAGVWLGRK